MTSILKSAASGIIAQKYNMDVIANNIANLQTTGFKKTRLLFADGPYENHTVPVPEGSNPEPDFKAGTGVRVAGVQRIFSPGSLQETGNAWDLAIAGEGFFQVGLPDGRKAYTRDGAFQIDGKGQLATAEGYLVDPPVTIPPGAENVSIDEGGTVRASVNGENVELGSIRIATFPNPEGLYAVGHNLFTASEASGEAQVDQPGTGTRGKIVSGVLEDANVDLGEEMTRAIEAQRAYELCIKVFQTADEMLGMANNLSR